MTIPEKSKMSIPHKRLCENPICSGSRNLQVAFTVKYRRLKPAATTLFLIFAQTRKRESIDYMIDTRFRANDSKIKTIF